MSVMSVEIYITIPCVAAWRGVFPQIVGCHLFIYIFEFNAHHSDIDGNTSKIS